MNFVMALADLNVSVDGPRVILRIKAIWDMLTGGAEEPDTITKMIGGTLANPITQTTVSLLIVSLIILIGAFAVTRKITKRPGRIQVLVEKLVTMLYGLVADTMGKHNLKFAFCLPIKHYNCCNKLENDESFIC